MRQLTSDELALIGGADGGFNYPDLADSTLKGGIGGFVAGLPDGGVGALPGAAAGATIGAVTYTGTKLIEGLFDGGASWGGGSGH